MSTNPVSPNSQYTIEFAIIETDDGLTVATLDRGMSAEETAAKNNGVLVDPGPYKTYDDAYDALNDLMEEREERE